MFPLKTSLEPDVFEMATGLESLDPFYLPQTLELRGLMEIYRNKSDDHWDMARELLHQIPNEIGEWLIKNAPGFEINAEFTSRSTPTNTGWIQIKKWWDFTILFPQKDQRLMFKLVWGNDLKETGKS